MVGLRLGAEAAGQLGIVAQTFGDSIRVAQISAGTSIAHGIASVTLDRGLYFLTGAITTIVGVLAALALVSLSHAVRLYAGLFVLALIAFVLFTALAVRRRWPVLSGSARVIGRVPWLRNWIDTRYSVIESVEKTLFDFHHQTPKAFWASLCLNLASHCMAVLEVCLILWLMGMKMGFLRALVIEALTKLVNVIGNVNPGNIGTFEGGNMLIGKLFGLSGPAGLALAVSRRLRSFFWAGVGAIWLFFLTKQKKRRDLDSPETSPVTAQSAQAAQADSESRRPAVHEVAFVIFLGDEGTASTQIRCSDTRVGALPILLRTILGAQKAGAKRIMVVVDPMAGRTVQRNLLWTRRLPASVEWIKAKIDAPIARTLLLAAAQANSKRLVLVDGNTTYHPSLLKKAVEWDGRGGSLALTFGEQAIGIHALSVERIRDCAERLSTQVITLDEFHACLRDMHAVICVPVDPNLWQRVDNRESRVAAEQKLDSWLVKPTDGIYARLNRRISIPISRQLIKFPITANMVSIFTLGVGFASAAFFALGGYWNTLLGALLCWWASVLDGCDGEVARLKLLESDFGCWLETICDYAFYLALFVGMTIGVWRSSGSETYLIWGGLLFAGAMASFLATGWQRNRLAAGRPEQLLKIWQAHAESRRTNPFLYFGRQTEFIVRRCFFPYALVVFALFNIMNVAFVIAAIGANLVWSIGLYSSRSFAAAPRSPVTSPVASV
jgi:uncharacterized protein (TIRG00374 family)